MDNDKRAASKQEFQHGHRMSGTVSRFIAEHIGQYRTKGPQKLPAGPQRTTHARRCIDRLISTHAHTDASSLDAQQTPDRGRQVSQRRVDAEFSSRPSGWTST
ncbi:hypothetical protein ACJQWK_02560 [Exserohilum turcicum]